MSLRASIPFLPFADDDIVIKLTGRYFLIDQNFIDLIKNTFENYDAYVLYGKHFVSTDHVFTGCFALKWKYFKQLINDLDFESSETNLIPIEKSVADFVHEQRLRVCPVENLHVAARIFFSGEGVTPTYEF